MQRRVYPAVFLSVPLNAFILTLIPNSPRFLCVSALSFLRLSSFLAVRRGSHTLAFSKQKRAGEKLPRPAKIQPR
jgi:hypothetical protein